MILNDIIKNEEKLLLIDSSEKIDLNFKEYLRLNKLLENIGKLTSNYFLFLKKIDEKNKSDNLSVEERRNKLKKINNELLNTDFEVDNNEIEYFTTKYKID